MALELLYLRADSKAGSWRQSGGLSQPAWLFRRKANPSSPTTRRPTPFGVGRFVFEDGFERWLLMLWESKLLTNHTDSLFQDHFRLIPQSGVQQLILRETSVGH